MTPRKRRYLKRCAELSLGHDPDLIARYLAGEQVIAQLPEGGDERGRSGTDGGGVSHSPDSGSDANDKPECHRVDAAKGIRDKAEALRAYLKKAREAEVRFTDKQPSTC